MGLIKAPRYALLQGEAACYACGAIGPVVAIAAPPEAIVEDDAYPLSAGEHGWIGLSDVDDLPAATQSRVQELAPGYRADYSATARAPYLMNHCAHCGAKFGDFFLHSKPDGPFFGIETEGLKAWIVDEPLEVDASFSEGPLGEWLEETVGAR